MAVVTFQKTTDAALAKSKYNGKIVDGSKALSYCDQLVKLTLFAVRTANKD